MLKRIVVLGLAAALVGIPVAIAKTSSSSSPERTPAVKPVVQKAPAAKQRVKARAEHDRDCPYDADNAADL
jgi:hypothetical protein